MPKIHFAIKPKHLETLYEEPELVRHQFNNTLSTVNTDLNQNTFLMSNTSKGFGPRSINS